ncbi:MAG: lipid-binding SYLF domain-containing protein [Candidatus Omnitrophica bacterium]|nr:lipid-binding SYLF domain-containing protein [Candidatus Omnitrophota bacterium]
MKRTTGTFFFKAVLAAVMLTFCMSCYASDRLQRRLVKCSRIFDTIIESTPPLIPQDLFLRCSALAVFPDTARSRFLWGTRYGQGIIMVRDEKTNTWSAPSFVSVNGLDMAGGFGFRTKDLILFIFGIDLVDHFLKESSLVTAPDVFLPPSSNGKNEPVEAVPGMRGIVCYRITADLAKPVEVKQAFFAPNNTANRALYNNDIAPREILFGTMEKMPRPAERLADLLNRYAGGTEQK